MDVCAALGLEFIRQQWRMWIETCRIQLHRLREAEFIRQQWRMWIETAGTWPPMRWPRNSFASNGECGLKLGGEWLLNTTLLEFIRQQWRMWIETMSVRAMLTVPSNSFASNGECGLKLSGDWFLARSLPNSFASNGECGLKQSLLMRCCCGSVIHSPAMANVD